MKQRAIVPASAIELAAYKSAHNTSRVVRTSASSEIYINKNGVLTIRKVGRSGGLNAKAKQLQACKGKGKTCVQGVLPKRGRRAAA